MIRIFKDYDMADPARDVYAVCLKVRGWNFLMSLTTPGVEPAADYKVSGKWVDVGYQLAWRRS